MHPDPNSSARPEHHPMGSDPRTPAFGAPNGARYKMLSPAKLPISRSPCLTVPPGISPGALLESPVLLTNIKAEPSPTTGTFSFHSVINDAVNSNSLCSPRGIYRNNGHVEGNSSAFEFKPHIRASSRSGLSSLGNSASVDPSQREHESCRQIGGQTRIQTLESSHLVQADNSTHASHELTPPLTMSDSPIDTSPSEANVPDEVASDDLLLTKSSDNGKQELQPENNGSSLTIGEKSAEDGYNWRKYGQKHVKGSEHPRSYYKCTHPNCQVKKQLERSHDGQITEIIYKGHHDHPKPEPSRRLAVGTILSGPGEERSDRLSSLASAEDKQSNVHMDPNGATELCPTTPSDDDVEAGVGGSNCNGGEVADDDDPDAKRRKMDNTTFDATQIGKTNREPRVVVQTISEVDILDDGYRWRKYGQKVVKGNPNPRSYYKCTSAGCSVRKHVERASHDPKAVITTYEGKHNHDVPAARNSSHDTAAAISANGSSTHSTHMPTALSGMLRTNYDPISTSHCYTRSQESEMISLDLGVGISANHNNCAATETRHQAPMVRQAQTHEMQQLPHSDGNRAAVQTTSLSILYGSSNTGFYGPRDGSAEGFSFRTPPVNHSSEHYYPNSGHLVMGP